MHTESRQSLADAQAAVVKCLTTAGWDRLPPAFDATRVALAAESLLSKRRRAVVRAWPDVADSLGEDFPSLFAAYAESRFLGTGDDPAADAARFARFVRTRGRLSLRGGLELFVYDLGRGFPLRFAVFDRSQALLVGVRLPLMRRRFAMTIPLRRSIRANRSSLQTPSTTSRPSAVA